MKAVQVLPAKVPVVWPYVAEWVSRALVRGHGDLSPEQIREHVERGSMQLWLIWHDKPVGVCVTELIESQRGRCCNLVIVAGEGWHSWAHLLNEIERWARDWNCVRLSLIGRKGWVRWLAGDGWTETAVTVEKVLGDG